MRDEKRTVGAMIGRSVFAVLFVCALALRPQTVRGFEWPVADRVLTATFGENRVNRFHTGIDIGGGEQSVYPIQDGEIVFVHRERERHGDLPSGLGSFVVVHHDQGVRSLYGHLETGSVEDGNPLVTTDDSIGAIGDTGDSQGKHLYLEVIDSELSRIVNPLMVLPPLADTVAPTIEAVLFANGETVTELEGVRFSLPRRTGELLIRVYDQSEHVAYFSPMAPYEITAYANGQVLSRVSFEELGEDGARLVLLPSARRSFSELYRDHWTLSLGRVSFAPGETRLDVVVTDLSGNESSRSLRVTTAEGSERPQGGVR